MDGAGTHFERGTTRRIVSPDGGSTGLAWFFVLLLVGGITGTVILLRTSIELTRWLPDSAPPEASSPPRVPWALGG